MRSNSEARGGYDAAATETRYRRVWELASESLRCGANDYEGKLLRRSMLGVLLAGGLVHPQDLPEDFEMN